MTVEELLDRLGPDRESLGASPNRELEFLIYAGMIEGPKRFPETPHPNWQWSEQSLSDVVAVIELKRRGFRRTAAIISQRWLEGREFPISVVRNHMAAEFLRATKITHRFVTSTLGMRNDKEKVGEYQLRSLARQLGQIDESFLAAKIDIGRAGAIAGYELARFGEATIPLNLENEPLAKFLTALKFENGIHVLAGLLETDDEAEYCAVKAIKELTDFEFVQMRDQANSFPLSLGALLFGVDMFFGQSPEATNIKLATEKSLRTFSRWPWLIFAFGFCANAHRNSRLKIASE